VARRGLIVPERHYDVIVLGRSLGALVAAALLARRDFTVLSVGQGRPVGDYGWRGHRLRRRAFTFLAASSPAWRSVMAELAQTQHWKRRIRALSPMLQIVMPGRRFDLSDDVSVFAREIEREFPEVRARVTELYAGFARVAKAADAAFERDAVWPPGTFLERRRTGRVAATLPYARAEPHADLLVDFPRGHAYRRVVLASARVATDLAGVPPAFAVARLHAAWTRDLVGLAGGEVELEEMLVDRIAANGGTLRLRDRVTSLELRRGVVVGVRIEGDEEPVGAGHVVTDLGGEELAALSGGQGISKRAQRDWPRLRSPVGRFVVSLVARRAGVPPPLGAEALILDDHADELGVIHLQRVETDRETLLVAEALLSEDGVPLREARAWVLGRLCRELPFLERHLLVVDSVHDGLPLWSYDERGRRTEVERAALSGASTRAEPMERQVEVDPPGWLGLGGEPLRGPIERTLLVGGSVLPALGQEGRLLAAASVARLITRRDRRRVRMRREMWTKMEIP
jgi:phytoene dehydrogenase-like protein